MPSAQFSARPFSPVETKLVLTAEVPLSINFSTTFATLVRVDVHAEADASPVHTRRTETNGVTDLALSFAELPAGRPLVCVVGVDAENGMASVAVDMNW